MDFKKCVHCSPAKHFNSVDDLGDHILQAHGFLTSYHCGGCRKTFLHKNSLIRHIRTGHEQAENVEDQPVAIDAIDEASTHEPEPMDTHGGSDNVSAEEVQSPLPGTSASVQHVPEHKSITESAARFLLDLRSSGNITGASVSLIQDYVLKFMKSVLHDAKAKTARFLNGLNVASQDLLLKETLDKFLSETFDVENPFKDLGSTDKQLDYFSSKFGLVKPDEKFLGNRVENRLDRKLKMFLPTQVPETFQCVSMLDTLKMVVRNPYLRGLILSEEPSSDGIVRNYKDGLDFKKNTFLQKYPHAVRLNLYQDDLETANVLGSKDTIHKLGCFYFSIQNFPVIESSHLSSVYLLALTYAEDLKYVGAFDKVLLSFIEELKILQSDKGVEVDLPEGGSFTLRACLVGLCADSLAAHAMLGFMSPSAHLFCRLCMVTKNDFQADSTAVGQIRTSALHESQLKKVEKKLAPPKQFGIKERTSLSTVMRVPEDSVLDAFHDLVGVIQMVIKLVCYEYICVQKLLTAADLNCNVNMFMYGTPDVKNKPSPNFCPKRLSSNGHSLRQSASQTFCLLRIFPFLIPGIREDDKYLELIFLLQDIVKIIFSYELQNDDIERLENLIYKHNSLFHEVFVSPSSCQPCVAERDADQESGDGESDAESEEDDIPEPSTSGHMSQRQKRGPVSKKLKKGINKLHHLMHYPKQIREKGPLIRLWTALFERRHWIVRKHEAVMSNFRNIPKSMAKMLQLSTLASILDRTGSEEDKFSTFGSENCLVLNSPYCDQLLGKGFQENDQILTVKSAELRGEEYRVGLFVSLKYDKALIFRPQFAVIVDILVEISSVPRIFLAVEKCVNQGISAKYNSYEVALSSEAPTMLVTVEELANFRPIAPWSPVQSTGPVGVFLHPRTVFL